MATSDAKRYAIMSGLMAVHHRIDLRHEEYMSLRKARELLIESWLIEERFTIALRDYEEFEEFIKSELQAKSTKREHDDWPQAMDRLIEVNRKLIHLLGTSTGYLETTDVTLGRLFRKSNNKIASVFTDRMRQHTKDPGEGKLWKLLRGHAFHQGIPSPAIRFHKKLASDFSDPVISVAHRLDVDVEPRSIRVRDLSEEDRCKLEILAAGRDARALAHSQMHAIAGIHEELTEQLLPHIKRAEAQMRDAMSRFAKLGGSNGLYPVLVSLSGKGERLEEQHLSLQWSDRYASIRQSRPPLPPAPKPIEVTQSSP